MAREEFCATVGMASQVIGELRASTVVQVAGRIFQDAPVQIPRVYSNSLALTVDDPDAPDPAAPRQTWGHCVLYNIPPNASGLATGVTASELPDGTQEGLNDWKRTGYGGPCPPIGRHRYFHKLYAWDTELPDLGKPTKAQLEKAMTDHVLAKAEPIGTYQKGK